MPKYVDQSSQVLSKIGTKFQNLTLNICSPRGFGEKFCHHTIVGLSPCLSSKIGGFSPIPNFWGIFSELWCSNLAKLQANATFGKTMEQLRNRRNIHLRSEITLGAKFLALGITPVDSDHAVLQKSIDNTNTNTFTDNTFFYSFSNHRCV